MLATVDQLARGRLRLGIGVGWMQEEFEALGIGDWYPIRGRVTDEWIAVCKELWSRDGASSYQGRFVSFDDIGAYPKPVNGHIPIWVGGWGDVAARRVARYGDGYQTISSTPEMVAEQLACVRTEFERRGRTPDQIEVSILGGIRIGEGGVATPLVMIGGSRQQIIDRLGEYRDAGLHHLIATPRRAGSGPFTPDQMIEDMQYLAEEILPALR
jgi:alkanesulfonate monooxygenase SsuD/methylene tetrahydromethanopterin reductase-like flavin-dependent oxidoreductase (luciferase family)